MKKSNRMIWLIIAFVFIGINAGEVFAQPGPKAIKRIQQVKKMKLLDELEIDDKQADKFIIKYTAWDDKIIAMKDQIDIARKELDLSIQKKEDKNELMKKANKFLETMTEMNKLIQEKNYDMRSVLTEEQYAKFLIFEDRFMHDLQKTMFRMMKKGDMPPPDFDDEMPRKPRKRK